MKTCALFLLVGFKLQTGIGQRFVCSGNAVQDELVDPALFLGGQHLVRIESVRIACPAAAARRPRNLESDLALA